MTPIGLLRRNHRACRCGPTQSIVAQKLTEVPTGEQATVWVAEWSSRCDAAVRQLATICGRDGEVIELEIRSSHRWRRPSAMGLHARAAARALRDDAGLDYARKPEHWHERLSTRLVRLLNMVPYFQANPGSRRRVPPPSCGCRRQAAGGGPQPAVDVRPSGLFPGRPESCGDNYRVCDVLGGHRPAVKVIGRRRSPGCWWRCGR